MGIVPAVDITPEQRKTILALLAKHLPNTTAWVYGSRVKWTARPQSDFDLVVFATPRQNSRVSALREAFGESNLPFRVDLFVWDDVPERFRKHIKKDHVVLVEEEERSVRNGWRSATIEEIAEKVAMGPFGSSIKVETFVSEGIPIISGQHLNGAKVDDSPGFNFITLEHAGRLANANVTRGDIVLTHRGNIGQVAYVPETSSFDGYVISQSQFYMRCDREKAIPEYLVWYFKSPEGQHQLLANTSQVGVPSIAQPVTYLRTLAISLPPLSEQGAIAHVLGTLDDKIELNRRMNETLEEMARALYKSWFVDFDPVRAKAALASPPSDKGDWTAERARAYLDRMDNSVAELFPDQLVDSELGEIPEGWEVKTLGELCEKPQYGYTASANDKPVGPRFLRITDINKMPWVEWSSVPYCEVSEHDKLKYKVRYGDILIARMADPGHGCVIEEERDAVFASYLIRFRPKRNRYARFLQYWLRTDGYWELVKGRGAGTTRVSLNAKVLSGFPALVPTNALLDTFGERISGLRSRVVTNTHESRILGAQRDELLPGLVSGKLAIVRI